MGYVMVVGALHLDVIVRAARLPQLDETLMGEAVDYAFGGKGGNQAVAAARMGAACCMAGRVGSDAFAQTVLAALDRAHVDRSGVRAGAGATGMSVAIVDAAGDYGAVVVSGANREISPDDIDLPEDLSVLALQNEIPEAVNLGVAQRLSPGVQLVLNAAPAREIAAELLARTDVLIVNRVEARMLAGPDVAEARLGPSLRAMGARSVLLTLGPGGVVIEDGEGRLELAGHPVTVQSTHGAGDAFVGALCARLAAGAGLRDAARFANAAAALHVRSRVEDRSKITPQAVSDFLSRSDV